MSKFLLLLALVAGSAFGADQKISAPSGNLILDAKAGSVVKVNKTLQVDVIKNFAGTSGAPGMVPIGGMVAMMPATHANAWQPPADCSTIKDGFMRTSTAAGAACVVPTCADCVIPAGTTLPNMYQKYTRGGGTSGSTAGSNAGHYHGMGSGTLSVSIDHDHGSQAFGSGNESANHVHGGSVDSGGVDHNHAIGGNLGWLQDTGSFNSNLRTVGDGNWTYNQSPTQGASAYAHGHTFTTGGISANHGHTTTVDLSNFTGSKTPSGTIGNVSTGFDGNAAGSNEPAYVETVWIIRVK